MQTWNKKYHHIITYINTFFGISNLLLQHKYSFLDNLRCNTLAIFQQCAHKLKCSTFPILDFQRNSNVWHGFYTMTHFTHICGHLSFQLFIFSSLCLLLVDVVVEEECLLETRAKSVAFELSNLSNTNYTLNNIFSINIMPPLQQIGVIFVLNEIAPIISILPQIEIKMIISILLIISILPLPAPLSL